MIWIYARGAAWCFVVAGLLSAGTAIVFPRYAKVGVYGAVLCLVGAAAVLVLGRVIS